MYAMGKGVEQSFTSAREWFQKAASQGHEHAIKELKRLDEHITKILLIHQFQNGNRMGRGRNCQCSWQCLRMVMWV